MLSHSRNPGLEAKNHEDLVSDFWIRAFKVKLSLTVEEKATKFAN